MLGKLIKHEWKSVSKFGGILLLTIIVVTALGYLFMQTPMLKNMFADENAMNDVQSFAAILMSMGSLMLYILLLVGGAYAILVYMGVHFYKSMYTDQGYLTHTLPVKPGQILASKILVSGIWTLLIYIAVYSSMFLLLFGFIDSLSGGVPMDMTVGEIWKEMVIVFDEVGLDINHMVVTIVLICLVSPFTSIMQIFGALTIGQLSKKHKLMMGILTYIGILVVNFIIAFVIETVVSLKYMVTLVSEMSMEYMTAIYDTSLIYSCVVAIVLYIVTYFIIKKKLNMD